MGTNIFENIWYNNKQRIEKERKEKLNGWHRAVKATIAFREE